MAAYLGAADSRNPRGSRPSSRSLASAARRRRFAHRLQCRRPVALGKAAAILVGDQRVVEIGRLGQAEQDLQQALGRGRRAQILAAHHQGDARRRIVDDAGEMIGGGASLRARMASPKSPCLLSKLVPSFLGPARQPGDR